MHANVDANILIRYILEDDETFYEKSQAIIDHENIFISGAVILKVVYVLTKMNLDYVDCYLYSLSKIKKVKVHTFDKKLEKTLKTLI